MYGILYQSNATTELVYVADVDSIQGICQLVYARRIVKQDISVSRVFGDLVAHRWRGLRRSKDI